MTQIGDHVHRVNRARRVRGWRSGRRGRKFGISFDSCLWPCLVDPKSKKFSRFPVTSNLAAHA